MKKVLILAYDFPPYVSVGGLRPYSWYKYFHEFGVYPIVVTRQWGNKYGNYLDYIAPSESDKTIIEESEIGTIIRTPYKPNISNRLLLKYGEKRFRLLRKVITAWYEFMQFLFFIGPKAGLYRGAKAYLKNHKVDAIIATGDPFVLFKYASCLGEAFNMPWIADYRDPWIQDKIQSKNHLRILWEKFNEQNLVKSSSGITTVSEMLLNLIQKNVGKNIPSEIVINGYNENNLAKKERVKHYDKLIITYAGSLYGWHPLEAVIEIFNELIKDEIKIELRFIGSNDTERIIKALQRNELIRKTTTIFPKMPNDELMGDLSNSHLLLLFNDYSIAGTKIYDYLAANRNIVFCFTNDEDSNHLKQKHFHLSVNPYQDKQLQSEIIKQTNSGKIVENKTKLKTVITSFWNEVQSNGYIKSSSQNIQQFSRKNSTKQMVTFINKIISA